MSRVRPVIVSEGSYRDAGFVNSIWEDFENTINQGFDGENFAEEGLDDLAFVPDEEGRRIALIVDNAPINIAASASWATFTMGVAFSTASLGDFGQHDAIRIRSYVCFEGVAGGNPVPTDELLELRHVYGPSGVLTTILGARSQHRRGRSGGGWSGKSVTYCKQVTSAIESWITGGVTDLQFVRLQYQLSGAVAARASTATLAVDRFSRSEVL